MYKHTLLIFIFLLSIPSIYSQELSEDFLNTLPEEIKDDVLESVNKQAKTKDSKKRA
jgi:hypothetical protein